MIAQLQEPPRTLASLCKNGWIPATKPPRGAEPDRRVELALRCSCRKCTGFWDGFAEYPVDSGRRSWWLLPQCKPCPLSDVLAWRELEAGNGVHQPKIYAVRRTLVLVMQRAERMHWPSGMAEECYDFYTRKGWPRGLTLARTMEQWEEQL